MTKLSKIGFSMEWFTADFLQFFTKNVKIWLLVGRLGTRHQIQAFQGFSGKFVSRSATREATRALTFW